MAKILTVDDELNMLDLLERVLSKDGHQVVRALNGPDALKQCVDQKNHPDLVIADLVMPGMDGLQLFSQVRALRPLLPFIILTGFGTIKSAVEAMRSGADDFVTKSPFDAAAVRAAVKRALERGGPAEEAGDAGTPVHGEQEFAGIIGKSQPMQVLFKLLRTIAFSHITVLIQGYSGTGKELVARAIHNLSPRRDRPFVAVDCGAMPDSLLESELFGHVKGSFTGALSSKQGLFEVAHSGTILLDEIGNTSPSFQAMLLRVLQEGEIRRVGSTTNIKVNVRLIACTNKDLWKMVEEGNFREDLYYRLVVMPLRLPLLRERKEDIPLLVNYFIAVYCHYHGRPLKIICQDALQALVEAPWPGNVRELENVIERAVVTCEGPTLRCDDLPLCLQYAAAQPLSLKQRVKESEKERIIDAILKYDGDKVLAAEELGISKASLYNKIKQYRLNERFLS